MTFRRVAFVSAAVVLLGGAAAVWGPTPLAAQSQAAPGSDLGALRGDLEKLKGELEGIKGELRLIRELLLQRGAQPGQPAAPARVVAKVALAGNPSLGRTDAPVTMIEFSDYQCPFCRRFFDTTLPALKKEYVDSGKLRYVFRDFPIEQIHPQARKAAEAARCAGDQGKYWEMHDVLFQNQPALQVEQLKGHAQRLGLDTAAFGECLARDTHRAVVQKDYDDGVTAGVRGTPAFFIGRTRGDDAIEGLLVSGAQSVNAFKREIERLLAEK